jgi:hypothetical protein
MAIVHKHGRLSDFNGTAGALCRMALVCDSESGARLEDANDPLHELEAAPQMQEDQEASTNAFGTKIYKNRPKFRKGLKGKARGKLGIRTVSYAIGFVIKFTIGYSELLLGTMKS